MSLKSLGKDYFYEIRKPANHAAFESAVFLDRDGVIIEDKSYLKEPSGIEFIQGAIPALKRLQENNLFVAIVTNQAGVARGLMKIGEARLVNERFIQLLMEAGVRPHCLMFCPYHPEGTVPSFTKVSHFRKPATGMFRFITNHYEIEPTNVFMIGDKASDAVFGRNIGAKSFLVQTGYGRAEAPSAQEAVPEVTIAKALPEAISYIVKSL